MALSGFCIFHFLHSCTSFDSFIWQNWGGFCLRFCHFPVQYVDPNTNIWRQLFGSQVQQQYPKSRGHRGSHEDTEAVLEHTRGLQGRAAHQLLAANGRNYLRAGEELGSEHIHTHLGLCEDVCEHGESIVLIPGGRQFPAWVWWCVPKGMRCFSIAMKIEWGWMWPALPTVINFSL